MLGCEEASPGCQSNRKRKVNDWQPWKKKMKLSRSEVDGS